MSLWDAMAEYPKYGWRPALIKSIPRLRLVEPALFVSSVIPCLFVKPNVFFDVNAPFGLQPLIPLFSKRARIMLKCVTSRLFCWIQVSLEKNQMLVKGTSTSNIRKLWFSQSLHDFAIKITKQIPTNHFLAPGLPGVAWDCPAAPAWRLSGGSVFRNPWAFPHRKHHQFPYLGHGDGSKPWYLVNPKIAGKWMFIPLKMVLIGIDPYPHFKDVFSEFSDKFQICSVGKYWNITENDGFQGTWLPRKGTNGPTRYGEQYREQLYVGGKSSIIMYVYIYMYIYIVNYNII